MNEVEKMMQNANVKKDWNSTPYGGIIEYYPPFTAEKQLELIKWLAKKDYGIYAESLLISIRDGYNYLSVGITTGFGSEIFYEDFTFDNKQFDEAIAGLINKLW